MKKLYVFASLYLHKLRKHMKEHLDSKSKEHRIEAIQSIFINNKIS